MSDQTIGERIQAAYEQALVDAAAGVATFPSELAWTEWMCWRCGVMVGAAGRAPVCPTCGISPVSPQALGVVTAVDRARRTVTVSGP